MKDPVRLRCCSAMDLERVPKSAFELPEAWTELGSGSILRKTKDEEQKLVNMNQLPRHQTRLSARTRNELHQILCAKGREQRVDIDSGARKLLRERSLSLSLGNHLEQALKLLVFAPLLLLLLLLCAACPGLILRLSLSLHLAQKLVLQHGFLLL